jgi:hypothetical protein
MKEKIFISGFACPDERPFPHKDKAVHPVKRVTGSNDTAYPL